MKKVVTIDLSSTKMKKCLDANESQTFAHFVENFSSMKKDEIEKLLTEKYEPCLIFKYVSEGRK